MTHTKIGAKEGDTRRLHVLRRRARTAALGIAALLAAGMCGCARQRAADRQPPVSLRTPPGATPVRTFGELGIPFRLFEAPTHRAAQYVGLSTCHVCGSHDRHSFRLGIGCSVVLPCPKCGTENGLDADDREDGACRSCGATVPFPDYPKDEDIHICYECLRAGKGAMTNDTEYGLVSWEWASEGYTHGRPGLQSDDFERAPIEPEEDWYGARIPREHLFELLRTPTYVTWQQECWLFCCKQPMTYIGEWPDVMKSDRRPADPKTFFEAIIPADEAPDWDLWTAVTADHGNVCVYVFECKSCGKFRAHWDMD